MNLIFDFCCFIDYIIQCEFFQIYIKNMKKFQFYELGNVPKMPRKTPCKYNMKLSIGLDKDNLCT